MQNPFAHATFRDHSRRFIAVVVVLAGLLLGALFAVRPTWRAIKERRARTFVRKAEAAMATNNAAMAAGNLRSAFALSPGLPEVTLALAEHYARLHNSEALVFWQQLYDAGRLTLEQQLRFADLAIEFDASEVAATLVEKLGTANPHHPDCLWLLARMRVLQNDPASALRAAAEAVRVAPGRRDLVRHWSDLQLRLGRDAEERESGKSRLLAEVVAGGPDGLAAARLLANHAALPRADALLLRQLLVSREADHFDARILRLVLGLRAQPGEAVTLLTRFRQEHAPVLKSRECQLTLQYLLDADLTPLLKDFVTGEECLTTPELGALRLESLGRCRQWEEMERFIRQEREVPLPKAIQQVYEAMAAQLAGRTNEVGRLWQLAITANQHLPPLLELIAKRAEESGNLRDAGAAWVRLAGLPEHSLRAAQNLVRLGNHIGELEFCREGYRKLARAWPQQPDLRLELGLVQWLLNADEKEAQATADFAATEPSHAAAAVLLALRDLRQLRAETAADHFQGVAVDWFKAAPRHRAIYAAALAASGQFAVARQMAATLDVARLSPQETALVRQLITGPTRP